MCVCMCVCVCVCVCVGRGGGGGSPNLNRLLFIVSGTCQPSNGAKFDVYVLLSTYKIAENNTYLQ